MNTSIANIEETLPESLSWDSCEIAQRQAEFLLEQYNEDPEFDEDGLKIEKTDDDFFEEACEDSDNYTFEWDWLCDTLTEWMTSINPFGRWRCNLSNFGWRHTSGYKIFDAEDGETLLQEILPKTDCTYKITIDRKNKMLVLDNAHHDAPTGGEMYYLSPVPSEEDQIDRALPVIEETARAFFKERYFWDINNFMFFHDEMELEYDEEEEILEGVYYFRLGHSQIDFHMKTACGKDIVCESPYDIKLS